MESCSSPSRVCAPQGRNVPGGKLPMKRSSKALCYLCYLSSSSTTDFSSWETVCHGHIQHQN